MEQRCHLAAVWLTWLGIPLLAIVIGLRAGWLGALFVLVVGVAGQLLYLRVFPRLSRWLGYGSVADEPAPPVAAPTPWPDVTFYSASVCPFCPIVRRRLADLQSQHPFEVKEVDVTFRPEIVRSKGLRSVPVLEANGRILAGNATSSQIAEFLTVAAGPGTASH